MRRGFTVVEMIVVLGILVVISVPMAGLFRGILWNLPRSFRMVQSHQVMADLVRRIRMDTAAATEFPDTFAGQEAAQSCLLINTGGAVACYRVDGRVITRSLLSDSANGQATETMDWAIPYGKIQWRKWQGGRAVEMQTWLEYKEEGLQHRKLENSHVFFIGAFGAEKVSDD